MILENRRLTFSKGNTLQPVRDVALSCLQRHIPNFRTYCCFKLTFKFIKIKPNKTLINDYLFTL